MLLLPSLRHRLHAAALSLWPKLPAPARWLSLRILYPARPVGVAALIRDRDGRLLLVRQQYRRGEWALVGGYAGRGETLRHAAERETREEVGLQVVAGRLLAANTGPLGHLRLGYRCELTGPAEIRCGIEIAEARWFALEDLPTLAPDARAFLGEALAAWDEPARP